MVTHDLVTHDAAVPAVPLGHGSLAAVERVVAIAREAGARVLEHYHEGVVVEQKGDRGPVTAADRAAHAVIVAALSAWDASVPLISEEGHVPDYAERRHWTRFWLVDPLDGTKEFIQRNGEFTVNIALIDRGEPVLGVVYAPALDLLYYAAKGLGAWKSEARRTAVPIAVAPRLPGRPLVIVESRSHPSADLERFLAALDVGRRIQLGSSLKFCWVAEGRADVYPRLGRTMEWDVAAGDCVFRNATSMGQNPSSLAYNTPGLCSDGFTLGM